MNKLLKLLFFALIVRPLIYVVLGLNIKNIEKLPKKGPAILVANHSSHIDTLILMSLFPINKVISIYPIAAKDYFCKTKLGEWFFLKVIEIIPINRAKENFSHIHPFENANQKLKEENIVIIYPEGTRNSETIGEFKRGTAHLAKMNPEVPVIPIYINGPSMVLPKGEGLLVPYICDVNVGERLFGNKNTEKFTQCLKESIENLKNKSI